MKYWPHRGEELPNEPPSPVLMVTKVGFEMLQTCMTSWVQVKTFSKEPHWVQNACEQIGLGSDRRRKNDGKVAFIFTYTIHIHMFSFRSVVGCSYPTCLQCAPSCTRSSMWWILLLSLFQMACLTISTRIPMASS